MHVNLLSVVSVTMATGAFRNPVTMATRCEGYQEANKVLFWCFVQELGGGFAVT